MVATDCIYYTPNHDFFYLGLTSLHQACGDFSLLVVEKFKRQAAKIA